MKKNITAFIIPILVIFTSIQSVQAKMNVLIPEPLHLNVDPTELEIVNEAKFNQDVMPQLKDLQFYSYEKRSLVSMPYDRIENYCYSRRLAVDAFLWFGQSPLKADQQSKTIKDTSNPFDRNATITVYKYLLPGFKKANFKTKAWIETARINVVGQLKTKSGVSWNNHEAVVIHTNQGVRIVDLSFNKDKALNVEEWLSNFAPNFNANNCVFADEEVYYNVAMELVRTQQFHQPWDPAVPKCAYKYGQRIDARDVSTNTGFSFGTPEERYLSAKYRWSLEEDLTK